MYIVCASHERFCECVCVYLQYKLKSETVVTVTFCLKLYNTKCILLCNCVLLPFYVYMFNVFGQGTGKETLVQKFASLLGYEIETIVLYQVEPLYTSHTQ